MTKQLKMENLKSIPKRLSKKLKLDKDKQVVETIFKTKEKIDFTPNVKSGKTKIFFNELKAKDYANQKRSYSYEALCNATIRIISTNINKSMKNIHCFAVPK